MSAGPMVDKIDPFKKSPKKKPKKSQGSSRYHSGSEADLQPLPLLRGNFWHNDTFFYWTAGIKLQKKVDISQKDSHLSAGAKLTTRECPIVPSGPSFVLFCFLFLVLRKLPVFYF